jgi:hypothetical protein
MTQAVKEKIIQKMSEAGLVVLILGGAVYFLWNDNQNYRLINDKRIERLESQIQDCTNDNIRILREEVQRGHQVIDKNTRAIEKMLER